MIGITQFERRMRSVPTGAEPVKGRVNAGDPPRQYMIEIYQLTPRIKAMPVVVVDLRSGHRSNEITSLAHILKHGRRKRQKRTVPALILRDHTNPEADQGIRVIRQLRN
jgi:hypothetical protein